MALYEERRGSGAAILIIIAVSMYLVGGAYLMGWLSIDLDGVLTWTVAITPMFIVASALLLAGTVLIVGDRIAYLIYTRTQAIVEINEEVLGSILEGQQRKKRPKSQPPEEEAEEE